MTALVPPELIFGAGHVPFDINNIVPETTYYPKSKLCAWTAIWRDLILSGKVHLDALVVVAGGDCHNALVDGQKVAIGGTPTLYFFYPFDGNQSSLETELTRLEAFLGGIKDHSLLREVTATKRIGIELDAKRVADKLPAPIVFKYLVSFSDLRGDINKFKHQLHNIEEVGVDYKARIALIGVPPIYHDFHQVVDSFGLHVVYDELPYEFVRLSGTTISELAKSYSEYMFAREFEFRLKFIQHQLELRKVDGVIHYTQYACHHLLEDELFRKELDYPMLTVEGDLPRSTPEQLKLQLEAFSEILSRR
jgi:hypothetical protein